MQKRHIDRASYFKELFTTSKDYFIPYILQKHSIKQNANVLEIGCGEGGNLLPFSLMGCYTVGVDIATGRALMKQKDSLMKLEQKAHSLQAIFSR